MIKLGNVKFEENEIKRLFFEEGKKFLIQFRSVYQINYSTNAGFSTTKIYNEYGTLPLTKRGRYFVGNANFVNNLVGRQLVVD
jgi:hypothetical protein